MAAATNLPGGGSPVALLMTDIVDSTALYQRVGDEAARRDVERCLSRMSILVDEGGGRVVKSLGDGLLCVFPTSVAVFDMVEALLGEMHALPLEIRTGVHSGPVLVAEDGDVFGDAVNTVARLSAAAAPGEVLVSAAVQGGLDESRRAWLRPLPSLALRGRRDRLRVFGLERRSPLPTTDLATQMIHTQLGSSTVLRRTLRLQSGDVELMVGPGDRLVLGRGTDCDLRLDGPRASRRHAAVQERGGHHELEDFSSNGSWVVVDGLAPVRLHRERVPLLGNGWIHCGAAPDDDAGTPIRFEWLD